MVEARRLQYQAVEMINVLITSGLAGVASGKACMSLVGVECGPPRLPMTQPTASQLHSLRERLAGVGFFSYASK